MCDATPVGKTPPIPRPPPPLSHPLSRGKLDAAQLAAATGGGAATHGGREQGAEGPHREAGSVPEEADGEREEGEAVDRKSVV